LESILSPGRLAWDISKPAFAFTSRGGVLFKMLPGDATIPLLPDKKKTEQLTYPTTTTVFCR